MNEGVAAHRTLWCAKKMQIGKAGCTKAIVAIDDLSAARAARWQYQIKGSPKWCHQQGQDWLVHWFSLSAQPALRKRWACVWVCLCL
jgi:hypothetical protein